MNKCQKWHCWAGSSFPWQHSPADWSKVGKHTGTLALWQQEPLSLCGFDWGGGRGGVRKGKKHQERLFTGCTSCLWRRRSCKSSALLLRSCSCSLTASRIPSIRPTELLALRSCTALLHHRVVPEWYRHTTELHRLCRMSQRSTITLQPKDFIFFFSDNHHILLRPTIPSPVDDDTGAKYSHCALWKGKKTLFFLTGPKQSQINYYTFKCEFNHSVFWRGESHQGRHLTDREPAVQVARNTRWFTRWGTDQGGH